MVASAVGLLIGIGLASILMLAQGRSIARREVGRLVNRGGLPADPELVADAERWFRRRGIVLVLGTCFGAVLAAGVMVATGKEVDSALNWIVMAAIIGVGVGLFVMHLRSMRSARSDGPRAATLHPRQLADYLLGPEIALQYGFLLLPLVSVILGVLVLTGDDGPTSGWSLVVAGLAAYPVAAFGIYLQQRMLRLNQPADGETVLRWQEALRATALRDLAGIVIGAGWLFGPLMLYTFEWPGGAPGFAEPLSNVLFAGSTLLVSTITLLGITKRGLQRSQRVVEG